MYALGMINEEIVTVAFVLTVLQLKGFVGSCIRGEVLNAYHITFSPCTSFSVDIQNHSRFIRFIRVLITSISSSSIIRLYFIFS